MYKTILVPVSSKNGLARAQACLRHAMPLVEGDIVLLHVFEPIPLVVGGDAHAELLADKTAEGHTLLNSVTAGLENKNISYRCRIEEGTIAETIIRVAHEENADLIIMYTDGRDGLEDMLLGSITERVLRNSDTTLLAVRR